MDEREELVKRLYEWVRIAKSIPGRLDPCAQDIEKAADMLTAAEAHITELNRSSQQD